jgi:hypothetical protein
MVELFCEMLNQTIQIRGASLNVELNAVLDGLRSLSKQQR